MAERVLATEAALALIEPVAIAVHFKDMNVMAEPIEQCTIVAGKDRMYHEYILNIGD